jgi:integrase
MDTSTETTTGVDIVRTYHQHLQGRGLRPTTIRAYTSWLSRLQADTDADLLDLSTEDLEAWLVTHQWAPASHAKAVQALRAFYDWAHLSERIDHNPAASLRGARVPAGVPDPCPDAVLAAALERSVGVDYWRLRIAADCGLRRAELAAVRPEDVRELPGGPVLRVTGKGGRVRHVPLPPDVAAWLAMLHGPLFPGKKRATMSPSAVGRWYTQHLGLHPHSLRHRYATRAYHATHDIDAVRVLLGHSSVATTQVYVAVDDDDLTRAAAGAWDAA